MTIYFDPTEARVGSRLGAAVLSAGEPLDGLEEATGGDILVTSRIVPGGTVRRPPGSILLKKATEGAFLIQRKSGEDLLNSIPRLKEIARRMLEWPSMAWLAYSGHFDRSRTETVVSGGHETGWGWNAFLGSLDAWQLYGGKVHHEVDDESLTRWVMRLDEVWLAKVSEPEAWTRPVVDTSHLRHDPRPWRAVLEGFPDVGANTSYQIADYCGDLKTALWWMSEPELVELRGVGKPTKEKWRKFMGLAEGQVLMPVSQETGEPLTADDPIKVLQIPA